MDAEPGFKNNCFGFGFSQEPFYFVNAILQGEFSRNDCLSGLVNEHVLIILNWRITRVKGIIWR